MKIGQVTEPMSHKRQLNAKEIAQSKHRRERATDWRNDKMSYDVQNILETMTKAQKHEMLKDIIQNMAERNNNEEIAKFTVAQLDGDAMQVVYSYARKA